MYVNGPDGNILWIGKSCRNLVSCEESMLSHFYHDFCISIFYIIFLVYNKRKQSTRIVLEVFILFLSFLLSFFSVLVEAKIE